MSDYFGALLRSSGLHLDDMPRVPAAFDAPSHRAGPTLELDDVQSLESAPAAAPLLQRKAAPSPTVPLAIHTLSPAMGEAAGVRSVAESAVATHKPEAIAATPQIDSQRAEQPVEPVVQTQVAPAHSVIRTALQWVASDPAQLQQPPIVATLKEGDLIASLPQQPGVVAANPIRDAAIAEPRIARRSQVLEVQQDQRVVSPASNRATLSDAGVARPVDTATARAMPGPLLSASQPMPRSLPREEVIEVSIGAVHVRVDAPPDLSVSRTPAATPAQASRAATPVQRHSSLARRALRRI